MDLKISFSQKKFNGVVQLPASKSISNRVLIINALSESDAPVDNLSDCDDTRYMQNVLHSNGNCFDIGHAGTAMRFLTAFLSRIIGKWEITGSERMRQRPIKVLVDALNQLGAKIEYTENEGCPPLRIYGSVLQGGEIDIAASVSSQYVSALMMIAPYMNQGLKIRLLGKIVSRTYLNMTIRIMRDFGAEVEFRDDVVRIAPHAYSPVPYKVESDWSGASYLYELLAVSDGGVIELPGLEQDSTQGDARQVAVWEKLGVVTAFKKDAVVLTKTGPVISRLEYDFVEMPDLVQSFAVACCMIGIPFEFSGVETLRIKETDRLAALVNELGKLGYKLVAVGDSKLVWDGSLCPEGKPEIATYHDHRMAMAFAPAALKHPDLTILDKEVVKKSFPGYWAQLETVGAELSCK